MSDSSDPRDSKDSTKPHRQEPSPGDLKRSLVTAIRRASGSAARLVNVAYIDGAPAIEVVKAVAMAVPLSGGLGVAKDILANGLDVMKPLNNWSWDRIQSDLHVKLRFPAVLLPVYERMIQDCEQMEWNGLAMCRFPGENWYFAYDDRYDHFISCPRTKSELIEAELARVLKADFPRHLSLHDLTEWRPTVLSSPRAIEILDMVKRELATGRNRSYLLHGSPGTGKSVMAAFLATTLVGDGDSQSIGYINLSRPLVRHGGDRSGDYSDFTTIIKYLSPSALVIDELDKATVSTQLLDEIHDSVPLVIYTANNGVDDRVVDSALVRPGRIDRTFEVKSLGTELLDRLVPAEFKGLDSGLVDEILSWPSASINEAILRASLYGPDPDKMGLDEIRQRVGMTCRSVKTGDVA